MRSLIQPGFLNKSKGYSISFPALPLRTNVFLLAPNGVVCARRYTGTIALQGAGRAAKRQKQHLGGIRTGNTFDLKTETLRVNII